MEAEALSRAQWCDALELLPSYPFFVTPRYMDAWIEHHSPGARAWAMRVSAGPTSWRLVAILEAPTSRFGTTARIAAPAGGYGVAGVGDMPSGWGAVLMRALRSYAIDRIELTLPPDETLTAFGAVSADLVTQDAWILELRGADGMSKWSEDRLEKRARRQLRRSEDDGVCTTRHGIEALEEFHRLYRLAQSQGIEGGARASYYSLSFLRDLVCGDGPGAASIYLTRRAGILLAGGLLLRGGSHAFAWIGCMDRSLARHCGNLHRHCAVAKDLCAAGAKEYNLGAAPGLVNVARFKQRLGARPMQYHAVIWRNMLLHRARGFLGRRR